MLDKMKQFMEMQRKMQEIKRQLDATVFEVVSPDGTIKLTMNGSQEVAAVILQAEPGAFDKSQLEKSLKDTYNRAIKRSHDIAAAKMRDVAGGMGLPGMV